MTKRQWIPLAILANIALNGIFRGFRGNTEPYKKGFSVVYLLAAAPAVLSWLIDYVKE